jgi:hypothetical protein
MKHERVHLKRNRKAIIFWVLIGSVTVTIPGCKNFFVGPTLTTVNIGPSTPSIAVGKTQPMSATGTYDNGTTETITDTASWSTSDVAIATVSAAGLVTGVASGSATISATLDGVSGSTTVNVVTAGLKSISITPTSPSISSGLTEQFTAIGTLEDGTTVDLTSSVTWTSSNTAVATIDSSGLATALTVSSSETTNITAQSGSITSNTAVLKVTGT